MRIEILDEAQEDLGQGFHFYEGREAGLGAYFLDGLFSDIDSLLVYAGIHQVIFGHHRCLSKRFPFAIYYNVEGNVVRVHAVLDCRRNPLWGDRKGDTELSRVKRGSCWLIGAVCVARTQGPS